MLERSLGRFSRNRDGDTPGSRPNVECCRGPDFLRALATPDIDLAYPKRETAAQHAAAAAALAQALPTTNEPSTSQRNLWLMFQRFSQVESLSVLLLSLLPPLSVCTIPKPLPLPPCHARSVARLVSRLEARQAEAAMAGMSWLHTADGELAADGADKKEKEVGAAVAPAEASSGDKPSSRAEEAAPAGADGAVAEQTSCQGDPVVTGKDAGAALEVAVGTREANALGAKKAFVPPLQYNIAKAGTHSHQQVLDSSTCCDCSVVSHVSLSLVRVASPHLAGWTPPQPAH